MGRELALRVLAGGLAVCSHVSDEWDEAEAGWFELDVVASSCGTGLECKSIGPEPLPCCLPCAKVCML